LPQSDLSMIGNKFYHHLVSIIIPNYNHADYLQARIDSVLNQTYRNFEVILLDDCSTDNSREIIEKYRNNEKISHIVYNEVNSGSTFKQWQRGIHLAKGEWIWMAESDDVANTSFLETLMKSDPSKVGLRFSASNLIDSNGQTISHLTEPQHLQNQEEIFEGKQFVKAHLTMINSIPNASAVLFRKELAPPNLLDQISLFKLNGDWVFWILIAMGTQVQFFQQPLNNFRVHNATVRSKQSSIALQEYLKVADLLASLGFWKEVSDRLRYLFYSKNLKPSEKSQIILYFAKKGKISSLLLLLMHR
jgi:glycosyltransferase involved in cell wall biosynthesis